MHPALVHGMLQEFIKLGFVTPEEAGQAIERYEQLQKSRPTGEQVARYAGLGAGATVGGHLLQSSIEKVRPFGVVKGPLLSDKNLPKVVRGVAGRAAVGAVTGGLLPLVRSHLDQQAEATKIHRFLQENKVAGLREDLGTAFGNNKSYMKGQTKNLAGILGGIGLSGAGAFIAKHHKRDAAAADQFIAQNKDFPVWHSSDPHHAMAQFELFGAPDAINLGEHARQHPGIVAHEWGHLANHRDSKVLNATQSAFAHPLPRLIAPYSGIYASRADNPKVRKMLQHVGTALWAPTLAYEAAATARGTHQLAKQQGAGAALRSLGATVPAWGSYLGGAIASHNATKMNYAAGTRMLPIGQRIKHVLQDNAGEVRHLAGNAGKAMGALGIAYGLKKLHERMQKKESAERVAQHDLRAGRRPIDMGTPGVLPAATVPKLAGVGPGAPMTVSEYSGPTGGGGFNLVSDQNNKAPPPLHTLIAKKANFGGLFPKGRTPGQLLSAAREVGTKQHHLPKGPSLDQIAGRVQPAFAKAPGMPQLKNWGLPPPGTTNPSRMLTLKPPRISMQH